MTTIEYSYDVKGRKASRTDLRSSTSEYYIYDGDQVIAELDESGEIICIYHWGAGIDNLISFKNHSTDTTYYAIKDHLNSVIAFVDEQGDLVERYEYDAFGRTQIFGPDGVERPRSYMGNRYMFQGRAYDAETDLYYFRARWYDPKTGRWCSKDPIGIEGGLNQYVAFNNNPFNLSDPTGLWTFQIGFSVTGGAISGGTAGFGLAVSYSDENGVEVGSYVTVGGGAYAGAGGSITVDLTVSDNDSISDLSGDAGVVGSSGTFRGNAVGGEINIPLEGDINSSITGSLGKGAGTSGEGHVFQTRTNIDTWWKSRENSCNE